MSPRQGFETSAFEVNPSGEPILGDHQTQHLRVLIAHELKDRRALVAPIVVALGHEVIAREIEVGDVGLVTACERRQRPTRLRL